MRPDKRGRSVWRPVQRADSDGDVVTGPVHMDIRVLRSEGIIRRTASVLPHLWRMP